MHLKELLTDLSRAACEAMTMAVQASLSDAKQNQNSSHDILAEQYFAAQVAPCLLIMLSLLRNYGLCLAKIADSSSVEQNRHPLFCGKDLKRNAVSSKPMLKYATQHCYCRSTVSRIQASISAEELLHFLPCSVVLTIYL